jgi:hypothetical protein
MVNGFEVCCPHCGDYVVIEQVNCAIFRHGVFKSDMSQINPHLPKINCDELIEKKLIYGCGKPFRVIKENNSWTAIQCDYI